MVAKVALMVVRELLSFLSFLSIMSSFRLAAVAAALAAAAVAAAAASAAVGGALDDDPPPVPFLGAMGGWMGGYFNCYAMKKKDWQRSDLLPCQAAKSVKTAVQGRRERPRQTAA